MQSRAFLKKSFGFGLIDCLVALALGAALLWQVAVLYKDMRQTHAIQDDLSQLLVHGQWFQDYFSYQIKTAGMAACLPKSAQAQARQKAVIAYDAANMPVQWGIKAAKHTQVLMLGSCNLPTQSDPSSQFETIAFYLKQQTDKSGRYTLYQKSLGHPAMALQQDIGQLRWLFASKTKQAGRLTAPQVLGAVTDWQNTQAIAWKVRFIGNYQLKSRGALKPLARTFYGYVSRREALK